MNRLPHGEDPRQRVSVRLDAALALRLDEFAAEHELTKSSVVRTSLEEYLPTGDMVVPADPTLREAYLWLHERADDHGCIQSKPALSGLAQRFGIDTEFVKHSRLYPLDRTGWISADFGVIYVHENPLAEESTTEHDTLSQDESTLEE